MLKTFKWVYNLGVGQERVRIAAALEAHANRARISDSTMANMLREELTKSKPNQPVVDQLKFSRSVNSRVQEIIADMFRQEESKWLSGYSIMFPDDKAPR